MAQGQTDIFGCALNSNGQATELIKVNIDLSMELARIGILAQLLEMDLLRVREHVSSTEPIKGCLSDILVSFDLVDRSSLVEQFFAF